MDKNYKFKTLYDPGTAVPKEDGFVVAPPFFGVFDAVSGLYDPETGPELFSGKSGGRCATDIAINEVKHAAADETAETVMIRVNAEVKRFCEERKLPAGQAENIPGLEFALAKISESGVELVQAGDAFAVWIDKTGRIGATPNQNYSYEAEQIEIIQNLIRKHAGDRTKTWKEYIPLTSALRREHANRGGEKDYVVLNGNAAGEKLWFRKQFPPGELKTLILFTDGLVDFKDTKNENDLAKLVVEIYNQGGLEALRVRIRDIETREKADRYVDHAEATAISIEF